MRRGFDLLALDAEGTLSVKNGRTPREVVVQALNTATWISELTLDDLAEFYARDREGETLEEASRDTGARGRGVAMHSCSEDPGAGSLESEVTSRSPPTHRQRQCAFILTVTPSQRSANGLQEPDSVAVLLGQAPIRLGRYRGVSSNRPSGFDFRGGI